MRSMIARRRFLATACAALLTAPLAVEAQPAGGPARIGFLPLGSPSSAYDRSLVEAFRQGLRDVGLVENRHVVLDLVWIKNDSEYSRAVSEIVQRGAKLLIPVGSSASVAAKNYTSPIPIVSISAANPTGIGLVDSLSRPGRNATGFSDVLADLSAKLLDLGREQGKPQAPLDYLWYAGWADGPHRFQATERAAQSLGVKLRARGIGDIAEVNDALAAMKKGGR